MEKLSFEQFFADRNPNYVFLLSRMQTALGVDEVRYDDINATAMRRIKDYFVEDEKKNAGTIRTYMAVIVATANELASNGVIRPINFKVAGKIRVEKTENVALTEEEVQMFVSYYNRIKNNPKSIVERDILTLFLIEMFTGARISDVEQFSKENISDGVLTYISKKTHTLTRVPAHKMLCELFARIPQKTYFRSTKNRIIKNTAKRLGIKQQEKRMYHGELKYRPRYEYLATHTARRTFVSTLLDKNVPIASVSKMAGHSSPTMTMRYYCSDSLNIGEEAMAFFKG